MKTDFCVCLPSPCPGVVFHLLWGGLRSPLDGHTWFDSGLSWLSRLSHGGMGSPSSAIADSAVDCGSVGSSTDRRSHVAIGQYHGVSSLVTLLWQPSCHGGMGSLFGSHCRRCSIYRAFLIGLWTWFVRLTWHCTCWYVLFMCCMCVFLVCTHAQGCLAMNEWLNWITH